MITAFLVNIMLPFLAVYSIAQTIAKLPQQPASADALTSSYSLSSNDLSNKNVSFDDVIFVCTEDGFKWIRLKTLLETEEHLPSKHHSQYDCALCYISTPNLDEFILTDSFTLSYGQLFSPPVYDHANNVIIRQSLLHIAKPRAPPCLFNQYFA